MDEGLTRAMAELAARSGFCLVATTGPDGSPHLDSALRLRPLSAPGRVSLLSWFSRRTVDNLDSSPRISISVLDARTGGGFQALGAVEAVEERAFLGGLEPAGDSLAPAELELRVRLESIDAFRGAPHVLLPTEPLRLSRTPPDLVEGEGGSVALTGIIRQTYPC